MEPQGKPYEGPSFGHGLLYDGALDAHFALGVVVNLRRLRGALLLPGRSRVQGLGLVYVLE